MIALFTKAQIVNIPDPAFKNILVNYYPTIDVNGDGEIQVSEAAAVTSLFISCASISNGSYGPRDITGIKLFVNLERLETQIYCGDGGGIKRIDLEGMIKLKKVFFNDTAIKYINARNCIGLDTFLVDGASLFNIDSVDMSGCINLTAFLGGNNILYGKCVFTGCTNLKYLGLTYGTIATPLNELTNLEYFSILATPSISLYLPNPSRLKTLIIADGANIAGINLSGCSALETFYLNGFHALSPITELDLSKCISLRNLSLLNSTSDIPYLNIKNGSALTSMEIDSSIHVVNICTDEFESASVRSYFATSGHFVNVNPYCSLYPGGNFNSINGTIRTTDNAGECNSRGLGQIPVSIRDLSGQSVITYSDSTGNFAFFTQQGQYTVVPYFPYPFFELIPTIATLSFDSSNNLIDTADFCIRPTGIYNDLEISFLPVWPAARPGMNASYELVYKNRGTTTLSGNVAVNFDNSKMNFVAASENVTSQSSGQLLWNYNNLQPFESRTINVTFNLLPPPVNNIGDTISYLAVITPSDNDETAFDNIFILPQRVIGSFDPNDKQCLEGSKLDIAKIGDYLHYVIRFQNEGTDTAFNIVVADTLSNNLDWSSFEFIGSSHSCNPVLKNNKAEFFFENINLPYKAINEPASNGWVAFKIKPKPSVVIGDSVNNTAAIYFDFNLPVITNKATTIVSNSSSPVPVKLEYFSANKKENSNQLNWKASCTYGNANFVIERSDDGIHFKAIGNINATAVRCQLPFNFTDNHPAAGKNYYRLKITDADGISFYSKVLVVGNNKAGVEIIAVANNVVYLNSNKQQTVTLKVITADGREVLHQKQTVGAGNNNISLQMKNAAKGIYTLIVYTEEGGIITNRFIK